MSDVTNGTNANSPKYRIAIHHDDTLLSSGRRQSFGERWQRLAQTQGHEPVLVDAYADDAIVRIMDCDAFMWYFENSPRESDLGKRLVSALEHVSTIPTFPDWKTVWTFEDKIAQHYLLQAGGIPTPKTWVFWSRDAAMAFSDSARYPLVLKLSFGITSKNVRLIRTPAEARYWIGRLFGLGVANLDKNLSTSTRSRVIERFDAAWHILCGYTPKIHRDGPIQRGTVLMQEFLSENDFDTRVTVIGDRAFAFRRFNRPGDFRASGSGRIDWNPELIDPAAVRLGFHVAARLGTQVVTLDILHNGEELVVIEISYYYEAWAVEECPGCWLTPNQYGEMQWAEGSLHPGDAIFSGFIQLLDRMHDWRVIGLDRYAAHGCTADRRIGD